mmetsp:Transcript_12230/g.21258  ORF Transcript_12230/g.21258 Transcript_12230/m.21258 type:complete len:100 (-) Transcript_12230:2-301(-)
MWGWRAHSGLWFGRGEHSQESAEVSWLVQRATRSTDQQAVPRTGKLRAAPESNARAAEHKIFAGAWSTPYIGRPCGAYVIDRLPIAMIEGHPLLSPFSR